MFRQLGTAHCYLLQSVLPDLPLPCSTRPQLVPTPLPPSGRDRSGPSPSMPWTRGIRTHPCMDQLLRQSHTSSTAAAAVTSHCSSVPTTAAGPSFPAAAASTKLRPGAPQSLQAEGLTRAGFGGSAFGSCFVWGLPGPRFPSAPLLLGTGAGSGLLRGAVGQW